MICEEEMAEIAVSPRVSAVGLVRGDDALPLTPDQARHGFIGQPCPLQWKLELVKKG